MKTLPTEERSLLTKLERVFTVTKAWRLKMRVVIREVGEVAQGWLTFRSEQRSVTGVIAVGLPLMLEKQTSRRIRVRIAFLSLCVCVCVCA